MTFFRVLKLKSLKPTRKGEATALRDSIEAAIRSKAILRGEDQRLLSRNGASNKWLIDMRKVCMQAKTLDCIAEYFWQLCSDKMPFQVGGMEVAAVPLIAAILIKSVARGTPVNGFIVRKERKTYGTGSLVEGVISDLPIVVVDDIFNSGQSLDKVRVILEQENKTISLVFAIIDYQSKAGQIWRKMYNIPVLSGFSLADFDLTLTHKTLEPRRSMFEEKWNFASPDPNFFHRVPKSFPVTDGRHVYFGSDSGFFWCLNAEDGSIKWSFKVASRGHKNIWSTPALHRGQVFFGSYDGNVYCLNSETGDEIWRFIGADWVGSSPALAPDLGLLFIGLEFGVEGKRGSVVALRLDTGDKVWEYITRRYTHASPVYWPERQLVACGSNDNEMLLFDAATGNLQWRFETRDCPHAKGSIRHAPAFDLTRGHVITGCANGWIYIIDVVTGREVWSLQTENAIYTIPLVIGDSAYIGSTDKCFYVLNLALRTITAKIYVGAKIYGPARLLNEKIYFGACNGVIYEVDPVRASVTGTHQLPDAVTNALSYDQATGNFYALTYINQLFALNLKTSEVAEQ